jgi:hypothetical protein
MPQHQAGSRNGCRKASFTRPAISTVSGVALAALVVCAGTDAARAGSDTMSTTTSFYDEVLQTIGLESGPAPDYSERSPLVVPPTRDLPPPAADQAPAVPGWPKDPDIAAKARAKVKDKPKPHPDSVVESARPLRPDELSVPGGGGGGSGGIGRPVDPDATSTSPAVTDPGKPSLFSFDFLNPNRSEYATFTGEPTRTSLTDPPPGYMTPSPDQPYGIGPEQRKYKVPTVGDRATPQSGSAGSSQQ